MILERDKKRVGGVVLTTPTIERRCRSPKSSGPFGEAHLLPNFCVTPPWHSFDYAASSRLEFGQNLGFQTPIIYAKVNNALRDSRRRF